MMPLNMVFLGEDDLGLTLVYACGVRVDEFINGSSRGESASKKKLSSFLGGTPALQYLVSFCNRGWGLKGHFMKGQSAEGLKLACKNI